MMRRYLGWVSVSAISLLAVQMAACSSSSSDDKDAAADVDGGAALGDQTDELCPVVVSDKDCDKTLRPFVFVHGTYGSADNFAHVAQLLASNGYCADHIVGIEYNSLGDQPATDGNIDGAIDAILAKFPDFTQVDLAGHSQGTSHCGTYLKDAAHAAKVAHYINFSGSPAVGDVDTLSLSSEHDLQMTPHHATGNKVKTVTLKDEDHFAVAASTKSFIEVYKYLVGKDPKYTSVQCGDKLITIEGRAETFADNTPVNGDLTIRELGDKPQMAGSEVKVKMGTDGYFGPVTLKRNVAYEITGRDNDGAVTGYQYFTPFKRSNRLVRLLTPASSKDGSPVGALIATMTTDRIVRGPNHTAIVVRWAGGAFRQDLGASLKIDGTEVLTDETAGAGAFKTASLNGGVVAMFLSDFNTNKKTDLGLSGSAAFIAFSDLYVDATTPKFLDLSFTAGSEDASEKSVKATAVNWPSKDLLVSVTFQ
jgi:hypothetical protein